MTSYLGILAAIAGLLVVVFTLKDIYTCTMSTTNKIIWTVVILAFSVLGCAAYYLLYKTLGVRRDPRNVYRERMEKRLAERA